MKEKGRDSKGRILHTGESQRTDGKYLYKYCLLYTSYWDDINPFIKYGVMKDEKFKEKMKSYILYKTWRINI